jgi:hypothetical protein
MWLRWPFMRPSFRAPQDPVRLSGELWAITTYFNPAAYETKLAHLRRFARRIRHQGAKLLIVELAFGDRPHDVPADLADRLVRTRSNTVLWQKERLLNLGLHNLPDACDKIAWVDGDLVFTNDRWVSETSERLERYRVVQPFDTAQWLQRGAAERRLEGVAAPQPPLPVHLSIGGTAAMVGKFGPGVVDETHRAHSGFAWAVRRNLIEADGFYDRGIVGGGDFVMASAMYWDAARWHRRSISEIFSRGLMSDLCVWSDRFHARIRGSVTHVAGEAVHMWHGSIGQRGYGERYRILKEADFDPHTDIALYAGGCWRWNSPKPDLHRRVQEYFVSRKEDG